MANVTDYLSQMQKLTKTNLGILKALNDAFFTKKNHIYTEIDDATYVIPSFLSLENKITALQENFENLVKSPENGEAYFTFDGNTRAIEVKRYNQVPNSIKLSTVEEYKIENNDIFKDFLTPVPYINLDIPTLPNDVYEVNVKKVIPKNNELKSLFKQKLSYVETYTNDKGETVTETKYYPSVNNSYADIYKLLLNYKEDADYVEYDTVYKLPIHKNIGSSTYVIESVVSDIVDNDLNEFITLKLRNNLSDKATYNNKLTYRLFDETIEKPLQVGDELTNYDGTGKVVITEVRTSTNTIVVKVMHGEYLNFIGTDTYDTDSDNDIHELSKLRFFAPYNFDTDKYIKIPLEEDPYVFVAVAPLNSRMNIQASWGSGLIVNAWSLTNERNGLSFKTYYDENVKNIGDVLFEMTSMITSPVSELSQEDFTNITNLKPELNANSVSVVQINNHLNNAENVKNIRNAYFQKKTASNELAEVQLKLDDLQAQLSNVSFDDTTGLRVMYSSQINQLNTRKNELTTTITKAIDNISLNANSAEIPIENAKYRIRGFYVPNDLGSINGNDISKHVIGVRVQYRYKNIGSETGTAKSFTGLNNEAYIYSDWNNMSSFDKKKVAKCIDGVYIYKYEESNETINEPSYNQIDIPISQGETVDIRVKLLYDFGQPYITVSSDWSNIINIAFPEEFSKDVPILTIIEENNNDIETNRFNNILKDEGVDSHVKDALIDQDITYYHKPDNIASGFYTSERRVIPLKDKLQDITNDIALLKNEIIGSEGVITVTATLGDDIYNISSDQENTIMLEAYNDIIDPENANTVSGSYQVSDNVVNVMLNINLANNTENAIKIYSVVPGSRSVLINNSTNAKKDNYIVGKGGVWFKYKSISGNDDYNSKLQTQNQFVTFRINDVWTGNAYYGSNANISTPGMQSSEEINNILISDGNINGLVVYPLLTNEYSLCLDSDNVKSYMILNPGEQVTIPMVCTYAMTSNLEQLTKTISFDIRTSLYNDPTNYSFNVVAKNSSTLMDKVAVSNRRRLFNNISKVIKYNPIVK